MRSARLWYLRERAPGGSLCFRRRRFWYKPSTDMLRPELVDPHSLTFITEAKSREPAAEPDPAASNSVDVLVAAQRTHLVIVSERLAVRRNGGAGVGGRGGSRGGRCRCSGGHLSAGTQ